MEIKDLLDIQAIEGELHLCNQVIDSMQFPQGSEYSVKSMHEVFKNLVKSNINKKIGENNPYGDLTQFIRGNICDVMEDCLKTLMQELQISGEVEYPGYQTEPYTSTTYATFIVNGECTDKGIMDVMKDIKIDCLLENDNGNFAMVYDQYREVMDKEYLYKAINETKEILAANDFFGIDDDIAANVFRCSIESMFDVERGEDSVPRYHEAARDENREGSMANMEKNLIQAKMEQEFDSSKDLTKAIEEAQDAIWDYVESHFRDVYTNEIIFIDLVEDTDANYAEFKLNIDSPEMKEELLSRLDIHLDKVDSVNFYLRAIDDTESKMRLEINEQFDLVIPLNSVESAAYAYIAEQFMELTYHKSIQTYLEKNAKPPVQDKGKSHKTIEERD